MDVIDSIKYFARFAKKEAVLENFKRIDGYDDTPGYDDLRSYVDALPNAPFLPELSDFVIVGHEEDRLKDRITDIKGYFLMIEYGIIQGSRPNDVGVRDISFAETVFVAHHGDMKGYDIIQESLIMDECERLAGEILKQMEMDNKEVCGNKQFMQSSISLAPTDPRMMYGAIGWGLTFNKNTNLF